MSYSVKVIQDSIAKDVRLTTLEVTLPRIVLAELNTHRVFSRSSASTRAIPFSKQAGRVQSDPYIPEFAQNQRGMQAGASFSVEQQLEAENVWLAARDAALSHATALNDLGVHKQWVGRLLEPFNFHTVLITATEWENFFNLRTHKDAQPEIQTAAVLMQDAMAAHTPTLLREGDYHLPLIFQEDVALAEELVHPWDSLSKVEEILQKVSVGRCARVSYLTHDGRRDLQADINLYERLVSAGHMSPLEHVARVASAKELKNQPPSNFRAPWLQYRKTLPGEDVFRAPPENE